MKTTLVDRLGARFVQWCDDISRFTYDDRNIETKKIQERYDLDQAYKLAVKSCREIEKELSSKATMRTIEGFMLRMATAFNKKAVYDMAAYLSEDHYPIAGIFVSAVCSQIKLETYRLPLRNLGFTIDYLFYNITQETNIQAVIDSPIGENCSRLVRYWRMPMLREEREPKFS